MKAQTIKQREMKDKKMDKAKEFVNRSLGIVPKKKIIYSLVTVYNIKVREARKIVKPKTRNRHGIAS